MAAASVSTEIALATSPNVVDGNKPFQLVPEAAPPQIVDADGGAPPEPPKTPAGKRPALTRVK